jgi:hypothetical protein
VLVGAVISFGNHVALDPLEIGQDVRRYWRRRRPAVIVGGRRELMPMTFDRRSGGLGKERRRAGPHGDVTGQK